MPEVEHFQTFIVRVPVYGNPDIERDRTWVRLARAIHHSVKPGVGIAVGDYDEGRVFLLTPFKTLDPRGDDMGNHEGHETPLVDVEVT